MVRLIVEIILFKHGLFWHACCEIPTEDSEVYYFDNEPYTTIKSPETLHDAIAKTDGNMSIDLMEAYEGLNVVMEEIKALECVGLTRERANRKMVNKLKQYFKERNNFDD